MMIALSVAKIYAKTLYFGLCWRCSPKSGSWGINGGVVDPWYKMIP